MKRIFSLFLALVMLAALCCSCSGGAKTTLYLLNWGEYLDPALIEEFEEQNPDIRINMTTTTTNEEMYTVCATEGTKIDIVVPSDYLVERFIAEDLLAELDFSNIPNFQYVEKAAQNRTFDPENKYSVPYFIGTVGIVYNKTLVDEEVDSWGILWDEKYANQIMMYDSIRDSMMVALAYLGYDINTTDPEELAEAGDLLLAQKPLVRGYGADNIKYDMVGGGVALGVDYSGSAVQAIMENEDLAYVVPKEGSNVWMDNFVVLKSSPNKEAAERFINFMCDPEVAAQNSEFVGYTTPNEAALEYVDEEFTSNSAYTIPDGVLDRCAYFKDLGDALQLYNDEWMKVKTAA